MDEFLPFNYNETNTNFYNDNLEFLVIGTIFSSLLTVMALYFYKKYTNVFVYKKIIVGNEEHPNKIVFTISPDNFEYYKDKINNNHSSIYYISDEKSKYNDILLNTYRSYRANYEIVKKIMKNNICESIIIQNMIEPRDYYELYTMFLVNNIPLEVIIIRDYYNCDDGDYSVKNVLKTTSRIAHTFYVKDCVVNNNRVYYIYNPQKDCEGFSYIKTIENQYMTLRYYRNSTNYGISIEKNYLGLKIKDLLYIADLLIK
jgi:hypothetical protein